MLRIGILTVSDRSSTGQRVDTSGPVIADRLQAAGHKTAWYGIVPDEQVLIEEKLRYLCDELKVDAVLTTGGTGLSRRDVTPEATMRVAERQVPGIAEAIRVQSAEKAPRSMLSRGVAVTRGHALIINFPGSPKAVRECMDIVLPVLEHAAAVLRGAVNDCAEPAQSGQSDVLI